MRKLKQKLKAKLGDERVAKIRKAWPIVRVVKNTVCWSLVAILALAIVVFLVTRISGKTPTLFGYSLHRVITESMEPELKVGDVILNKNISNPDDIRVGDIVTFNGVEQFNNQEVTHRVKIAPYVNEGGETVLVTQGDANEEDDGEISIRHVNSKVLRKSGFLTWVYGFFFSAWGLALFIFLLLLIFVEEIFNIFRLTGNRVQEEDTETFRETMKRIEREEREKIKQSESKEEEERAPSDGELDAEGLRFFESYGLDKKESDEESEESDDIEPDLSISADDEAGESLSVEDDESVDSEPEHRPMRFIEDDEPEAPAPDRSAEKKTAFETDHRGAGKRNRRSGRRRRH